MPKEKQAHTTARDFFSHLLAISMLYAGVLAVISLLFQYINVAFPDPLDYYLGSLDTIRYSMAALIVVWPVYLVMSWLIRKDMKAHPAKADIWVRKWLMYLTLFVSAVTIIVDLVTLIDNFLGGELTVRFGLKVLVVLLVAVAVFWYYLWDLKEDGALKSKVPLRAAWISSLLGVVIIVSGFFFVGTPATQRTVRLDDQRTSDLSTIQYEVIEYWRLKGGLPSELGDLQSDLRGFIPPTDPETGLPYEYRVLSPLSFELCASFGEESKDELPRQARPVYEPYFSDQGSWQHDAGRFCFDRIIDPELYPKPELR